MNSSTNIILNSVSDVIEYFKHQETPYYFVSATNFNLMNTEKWVNNWKHINLIDCFDGKHPSIFLPTEDHKTVFNDVESVNEYLLTHPEVLEKLTTEISHKTQGNVLFLFFNEKLEELCQSLNLAINLPSNNLVKDIDNKITTTLIGNEAGVKSVPNALAQVTSYKSLRTIADSLNLGLHLVVQTAYGDSGKTTFFISSEHDYSQFSDQIEAENKVKVMKRINCSGTAIEGCATRSGTFVGPLLSELIGMPELTPYQGGWCGNELYADAFPPSLRKKAQEMTERLGNALYKRGYKGYFEVDYLIDLDTDDVYLGELNPRITGISAMTNTSQFCNDTAPLFLFHLLEYSDINFDINPSHYNLLSANEGAKGVSGQLISKYVDSNMKVITEAPVSGIYKLKQGENGPQLVFQKPSYDRTDATENDEVFILRIMQADDYAYKGGDLAIMFTNVVLKASERKLTLLASSMLEALNKCFKFRNLTDEESTLVKRYNSRSSLKGSVNISESEGQINEN